MFHACSLETKQLAQGDSQEGVVKARRARSGPAFSAASLWLTLDLFGAPQDVLEGSEKGSKNQLCVLQSVEGCFQEQSGSPEVSNEARCHISKESSAWARGVGGGGKKGMVLDLIPNGRCQGQSREDPGLPQLRLPC